MDQLGFVAKAREDEAGGVGKARGVPTGDSCIRRQCEDAGLQPVPKFSHVRFEAMIRERKRRRLAKADDAGTFSVPARKRCSCAPP